MRGPARAAIIEAYIDLFCRAIARCETQGGIMLPLSGGQDSRHIFLELCRQGRRPDLCCTVDMPWKPAEATLAAELCRRTKTPHQILRLNGNIARAETKKNPITDYSSTQHAWMAEAVFSGFARRRIIFDGIAGDVLSAGLFLTEQRVAMLAAERIDELVEDIVGPEEHVFGIRDPLLFPRWRALERVDQEFRRHLDAPDPISSFFFWNRTRRDIGCSAFGLLRHSAKRVFTPYLDPDLSTFLYRLPPAVTMNHTLHQETIARAYPEFADMPYATATPGLASGNAFFRKVAAKSFFYVLMNQCPVLSRKTSLLRLLRSLVLPSYASEAFFLAPQLIYLIQLFAESDGQ